MKGTLMILMAAALTLPVAAAPLPQEAISVIQMDNVPLPDALRQLARQARLNVILDPKLSQPPYSKLVVSVRWERVTAREALIALLDNYGLDLVESPRRLRN